MFITDAYTLRALKTYSYEFTTTQTGTILFAAQDASSRFVITDWEINVGGATNGTVTLFDETNAAASLMFKHDVVAPNRFQSNYSNPFVSAIKGNNLRLTTSAGITLRILVRGYHVGIDPNTALPNIPV